MYAYFKKLDYFSTECLYAPFAARGYARDFVKDLEVRRSNLTSGIKTRPPPPPPPAPLQCCALLPPVPYRVPGCWAEAAHHAGLGQLASLRLRPAAVC